MKNLTRKIFLIVVAWHPEAISLNYLDYSLSDDRKRIIKACYILRQMGLLKPPLRAMYCVSDLHENVVEALIDYDLFYERYKP